MTTVARIFKRCPCPEEHWEDCPHQWVVRYRTTGGRSSRQHEQSFADDRREAEDFALKVEHDKRAHTFVDPKAGRTPFRDAAETWLGQQRALADFLRLDVGLLTIAAQAIPPLAETEDDPRKLARWIRNRL